MRSVLLTAMLTAWLGLPGVAAAQDPEPVPAPAPAPPQAREGAVRRPERMTVRDSEARTPDSSQEQRGSSRAVPRTTVRETPPAGDRPSRRETSGTEGATMRPATVNAATSTSADDEEQRSAQRRGDVRRPPSGPSGGSSAGAPQGSRDHAVPRSSVPPRQTRVLVYPDYYRYYNRYYDPWGYGAFGLGYFYYSPWGWNPGYYYGPGYGYGYGAGYGYGGGRYSAYGYELGTLKLKIKPRDAEVFVDGYFAGYVDDFDGIFQSLKLDTGGHRVEIRKPGFETLHFDAYVRPDHSTTFRGELKPTP
jgi:hypothetical protein